MTDDGVQNLFGESPRPKAGGKAPAKRHNKAKENAVQPTRETWWGRRVIISECRVPDFFTQETFKKNSQRVGRHKINPGHVKAVLHEVAAWDQPGKGVFPGNAYVAHDTQLSHGTVNNCILALKQAKILVKKPGHHITYNWILNWDLIETLRVKYVAPPGKKAYSPDHPDDEPAPDAKPARRPTPTQPEQSSPAGGPGERDLLDQLTGEVLERFWVNDQDRLTTADTKKAIVRLRQTEDVTNISTAIEALDENQIRSTLEADNPGAYLYTVLSNMIRYGTKSLDDDEEFIPFD